MQVNVCEWLIESASNYPNQLALIDPEEQYTYCEYKKKSQAIARKLIEKGVYNQRPVVVFLEKSSKVLVSFMGIAMARNFYSPIDVDMPKSRVDKILEVFEPSIVITTKKLKCTFETYDYHGEYLIYDDITCASDDEENVLPVLNTILDTDLLYVLFTSGSTGVPKGVGIRHKSVIDYTDWVVETFDITKDDRFANQAPFYFDNSILDIYSCMKSGATLYVTPKELFSQPVPLLEYLRDNQITTIFWVPSALITVAKLRALKNVDLSEILKRVLFCGEVMPNKQLNFWRSYLPKVTYANLYGPTEITDACTYYIVDREFAGEDSLPIGYPMRNTEILVLDDNDQLIPNTEVDKIGELCVRGTSLAVGYYKNPEKTAEAFVQNPLNNAYEEKIYRTGDLVQYNDRGEIIYIGRKDFQIKHMGHRIELGEIETAASSLEDISRCCCVYDEKRSKIVMFVETEQEIDKNSISERLKGLIPEYMVPGKYVPVFPMPLNGNGKIDRKILKENL